MKTLLRCWLVLLILAVAIPCFALRSVGIISKDEAREMGLEIRARPAGPDAAWLELEFKPEGKLKHFSHVEIQINDGDKPLVAYAGLRERRTSSSSVVVMFMASRAYLEKITLELVMRDGDDLGYDLRVKEFVDLKKIH